MTYHERITIEPGKRSGKPCIRGMRITVYDVLSYLASGMTYQEILEDFPYLTQEDILACLSYAAERERQALLVQERGVFPTENEFSPERQSKHLLGYAQITARAVEVFGDVQIALSWLREPNPALAGEIPLDLVDTEAGVKQVDTVLGRIEHGIFC